MAKEAYFISSALFLEFYICKSLWKLQAALLQQAFKTNKSAQSSESEFVPCIMLHFVLLIQEAAWPYNNKKPSCTTFSHEALSRGKVPFPNLYKGTKQASDNSNEQNFSR